MKFQHGQLDENGAYRGYSYGLVWAGTKFFFGFMVTLVLIGLPLLFIAGPLGWLLEILWITLVLVVTLFIRGSRGLHAESRREAAAVAPDEPVYDGDVPVGYKPPSPPGGRSIGTKFQS